MGDVARRGYKMLVRKPQRNRPFGKPNTDGRTISGLILNKRDERVRTRFIWLNLAQDRDQWKVL